MRIAVGADHGGYSIKDDIINMLKGLGHEVSDAGAYALDPADDYPDFAKAVAEVVAAGDAERGIVICGSGVGACVAANKVRGVRACVCHDTYSAHQGVEHDDMNVLCLGSIVSIAGKAPANLYHFVIDNGVYAVTGGQPVPNSRGSSFAGMAKAAGYSATDEFDDLEEFATTIDEIMNAQGPILVAIKSDPEVQDLPIDQRPRSRRTPQAIKEFKQALSK